MARYRFARAVASSFTDPHRRVLLVGEAAHLFPPFGARGMNSAFADAAGRRRSRGPPWAPPPRSPPTPRTAPGRAPQRRGRPAAFEHLHPDRRMRVRQGTAAAASRVLPAAGDWLERAAYGPRIRTGGATDRGRPPASHPLRSRHASLLIVDNYDSFTYNLYQLLGEVSGHEPVVVTNDTDWDTVAPASFDAVVLSPGPGTPRVPADIGICRRILEETDVPVLGICLGHQLIGDVFGGAGHPRARRRCTGACRGWRTTATRCSPGSRRRSPSSGPTPPRRGRAGHAGGDRPLRRRGRHGPAPPGRPVWGVQFHPESVLTEHGLHLLRNFLRAAGASRRRSQVAAGPYRVEAGSSAGTCPDRGCSARSTAGTGPRSGSTAGDGGRSIMGNADGVLAHTVATGLGEAGVEVTSRDGTTRVPGDPFTFLNDSWPATPSAAPTTCPATSPSATSATSATNCAATASA